MNRAAFEYLYINANSIAELGLERFGAALEMAAGVADESVHADAAESESLGLAQLGKMDQSQLSDGFEWETAEHDAALMRAVQRLQESQEDVAAPPSQHGEPAVADDLAAYLEQAYSTPARTALQLDRAWARAERAGLEALLAALPAGMPALTGALDPKGLEQWLTCYGSGHAALDELVTSVRALALDG
jgi:hypothetical protein